MKQYQRERSKRLPRTAFEKVRRRVNRLLGNPRQVQLSLRDAIRGIRRSGIAVARTHNVGIASQFIRLFLNRFRYDTPFEEFYFYQFYFPDRRQARIRHFPTTYVTGALRYLVERSRSPDCRLLQNKDLFARRCEEAGLPHAAIVGEFRGGSAVRKPAAPPTTDLFSKPTSSHSGQGARSWRYVGDSIFLDLSSRQEFTWHKLIEELCSQSIGDTIILQKTLRNHSAMAPLTNGALCTVRIVTCRTPDGAVDFLLPVVRMPAGCAIVDNLDNGGLAAPVDLQSGTICGPAIQRDDSLGIKTIDVHPDSDARLEGFALPLWAETISLARRAHEGFPSMRFAGWDIAILPDGPILLEGNPFWGADLTVLPHRTTLADTQFIPYWNFHFTNCKAAADGN